MTRRRPGSVLAMGIVNLVYGALCLLCGCFAMIGAISLYMASSSAAANSNASYPPPAAQPNFQPQPQPPRRPGQFNPPPPSTGNSQADIQTLIDKELPHHKTVELGMGLWIILSALLLILSGIGLIMMQGWARWVSIIYAAITIITHMGYLIFKVVFVYPIMERFIATAPEFQAQRNAAMTGAKAAFFGILGLQTAFFVIHAIVLLLVMLLPSVSGAFAGRPASRFERDHDDFDDREDEYRYRRPSPRRDDWDD